MFICDVRLAFPTATNKLNTPFSPILRYCFQLWVINDKCDNTSLERDPLFFCKMCLDEVFKGKQTFTKCTIEK